MPKKSNIKKRLSSFQIILLGFAGVILLGALLLMLPISSAERVITPFNEALFTSTSAVCVTGLVVKDTGSYWSSFGQAVIITLIQIGGLGVVTIAASFSMLAGRRISLMQRSTMQDAQDYKYFPEPDLPPIELSDEYIEGIRASLPELPEAKKARYISEYSLTEYDANILCSDKAYAKLFDKTVEITKNPKDSAHWIMGNLMKLMNDTQTLPENISFRTESLGEIVNLVNSNKVSRESAKKVLKAVFDDDVIPEEYVKANNMEMVSDTGAIQSVIEEIIANNEKAVAEYKEGKDKSFNFLVGQSMRALKGKAPSSEVTRILKELLG